MKLLFDQYTSPSLVNLLSDIYPESNHVINIGLDCSSDNEIIKYAERNDYIIITKDIGFSEMSLLYNPSPKIVWIRRGNYTTQQIENILRRRLTDIEDLCKSEPSVLVITEKKKQFDILG